MNNTTRSDEARKKVTSSVYDCTVEGVFTTELVTDVFYIFNSTVVD